MLPLYQNPDLGGGPLGWKNCNSTSTAMLIALETNGAKRPTGGDVRACTVNQDGHKDVLGGTKPSQNVDAAQRCWNVQLDAKVMPFEDVWRLGKREDIAYSISISYSVVASTPFNASPGFTGYHQVVYTGGKVYDPLADGRRGLPQSPQVWPKDLLRRAAGKYASTGIGRATVIEGRAPAVKPHNFSVLFEPGAIYVYPKVGARYRDGFATKTSAPCTAPFTIPWKGGKKRVVEILAGRLMGQRVEPTATHMRLKEAA